MTWFIDFLMYDIEQHLKQNFAAKLDSVARSLERTVLLRSPTERFSMAEIRREAALRPLHRMSSSLWRRAAQLPL